MEDNEIDFTKFLMDRRVTIHCTWAPDLRPPDPKWVDCDGWKCTLRYQGRRMTVPFFQGFGHNGKEPTAADVLHCLIMDADSSRQTFEEFAREMGYDEDSRTAEKVYRSCKQISTRLDRFLGSYMDDFRDAARNH